MDPPEKRAMIFNPVRKYDVSPQISTQVGLSIEVVYQGNGRS